jgi:hypothetical protein
MRPIQRLIAAAALICAGSIALAGCQGDANPYPPNGPSPNFFSTNNALVRFVQGSPDLDAAAATPTVAQPVDVEIDGQIVATNVPFGAVVPFNPSTDIASYYSVPSGQVLVELLDPTSHALIALPFAFTVKTGDRWSIMAGGNHIGGANGDTFEIFAANDGHYLTANNGFAFTFHNDSPNQGTGSTAASFSCTGCNGGPTVFNVGLGKDVPPQLDASNDNLNTTATGDAANSPVTLNLTRTDFLPQTFNLLYVDVDLYQIDANTTGDSEIIDVISQNG